MPKEDLNKKSEEAQLGAGSAAAEKDIGFLEGKEMFVRRLKLWRRTVLQLRQDAFAAKCGLNVSLIKKYEMVSLPTLPSAHGLLAMSHTGVNLHWLLTGHGRMDISRLDAIPQDKDELLAELKMREIAYLIDILEPKSRIAMIEYLFVVVEAEIRKRWHSGHGDEGKVVGSSAAENLRADSEDRGNRESENPALGG